ncbi:MAG: E3 ubiquitin-protein ligase rbbp6, partial [Paramarteilia canceri]
MSQVRYRLKSAADYEQLHFEGVCLGVAELKRLLYEKRRVDPDSVDYDLIVTDSHSDI